MGLKNIFWIEANPFDGTGTVLTLYVGALTTEDAVDVASNEIADETPNEVAGVAPNDIFVETPNEAAPNDTADETPNEVADVAPNEARIWGAIVDWRPSSLKSSRRCDVLTQPQG